MGKRVVHSRYKFSLAITLAFACCLAFGLFYVQAMKEYKLQLVKKELPSIIETYYLHGARPGKVVYIATWPADSGAVERFAFGLMLGVVLMNAFTVVYSRPLKFQNVTLRLGPVIHLMLTIFIPVPGLCRLGSIYEAQFLFIFVDEFSRLILVHLLVQVGFLCWSVWKKRLKVGDFVWLGICWFFSWLVAVMFYNATPFAI